MEFFERGEEPCEIVDDEEGVLFVHYPDGRATGDAFVMFKTEEEVNKALMKHKATMGTRYIELFRSTNAEVQQVFKRSQDPKFYHSNFKETAQLATPLPILPPEMISGGNRKDCIRLRNLPVECGVEQILEFLGVHSQHIIQQGVHMIYNAQGRPSGEAFIQFDGEQSALNVSNYKNGKCMYFAGRKYFIEVIQCSGEEMNLVLMGILPSNLLNAQMPGSSVNLPIQPGSQSKTPLNFNPYLSLNQNQPIPANQLSTTQIYYSTNTAPLLAASQSQTVSSQLQSHNSFNTINSQLHFPTNGLIANSILQANQFAPNQQFAAPIIYYLTPPVSPSSSNVYLPQASTALFHPTLTTAIVILKGAPVNITVNDVLQFFSGYEILPECVQMQSYSDGYVNSLNVFVNFFSRVEAEKALIEKNHQKIGNHLIELFLAI